MRRPARNVSAGMGTGRCVRMLRTRERDWKHQVDIFMPDSQATREDDLANWHAFSLAYYEIIVRALRLLRVREEDVDELTHSFLLKAAEKSFLEVFRRFREREAAAGRRAGFRTYLYRSLLNHVRDSHRKRTSRSTERSLDPERASALEAAPVQRLDPDAIYALDILHEAVQALKKHCERTGKPHLWVAFEETLLVDEFRGRPGKTRAELLAEFDCTDPQFLDNALTTAKRAFRRFVQEIMQYWPEGTLEPSERFTEWLEILRGSNASQFDLLHVAFRVAPHLGDSSQAESAALVVDVASGGTSSPIVDAEPAPLPEDDELAILLGFWLELPLTRWLDLGELAPYIPESSAIDPRPRAAKRVSPTTPRPARPLCLLTLVDPTEADLHGLEGADVMGLLLRLKSWAKQLHRRTDHFVPEVFAELVYTAINVLAMTRYGASIHSIGSDSLANNVRWFLGKPWLDDRLRPLLRTGLAVLERTQLSRL